MLRFVASVSAALVVGWVLVASPTAANAGHHSCGKCGPIAPTYTYKTKKVFKTVKHYRDVTQTKYVQRTHRIVHVTKIQPVIRVHNVTRIHTQIVPVVHPVHQRVTKVLPAQRIVVNSVVRLRPTCGCAAHKPVISRRY
jgi:hypothetical protein